MRQLKTLGAALVLTLAGTVSGGTAFAQEEVENAPDPWIHAPTGTRFPARLGTFTRTTVFRYSPDGRDASASYRLDRDGKWINVTLYVYPAHPDLSCEQVFAGACSDVDAYEGAKAESEVLTTAHRRGAVHRLPTTSATASRPAE